MQLIKDWRQAWKFTSVQSALILAVANGCFALVPFLSDAVSMPVYAACSVIANVAIVVLRLVAQPRANGSTK